MKDLKANKKVIEICSNIFYPMLALTIVLAVWAICAKAYGNPLVLPAPDVTLREFFKMFAQKLFWVSIGLSLLRTILCFVLSFVLALLFATLGNLWLQIGRAHV